jgi:hypothetical protein
MPKTKSRKYSSRKSNRGYFKKIKNTTGRALPLAASGLKKVGSNVKNLTMKSKPVIEKGLGVIYKTVTTGFDLGLKGVKKGINVIKSKSSSKTRRRRK